MRKFKKLLLAFVAVLSLFMVASCGVSESYANKVNKAAEKGEHITYEEVMKKLGDAQINLVVEAPIIGANGAATWIKGCDTVEEAKEKVEKGKTVYCLVITFAGSKAQSASWTEYTPE